VGSLNEQYTKYSTTFTYNENELKEPTICSNFCEEHYLNFVPTTDSSGDTPSLENIPLNEQTIQTDIAMENNPIEIYQSGSLQPEKSTLTLSHPQRSNFGVKGLIRSASVESIKYSHYISISRIKLGEISKIMKKYKPGYSKNIEGNHYAQMDRKSSFLNIPPSDLYLVL